MSPRRRAPQPPDIRVHLLDAALRAFAHKGYEAATVRDIAAEAQVAPGLLYHYFPSKQAVLEALFERSASLVMEAFARAAAVEHPADRLAALVRVSAQLVTENLDFWRVSYGVRFQGAVLGSLAPQIAQSSQAWVGSFTALLTELGHPRPDIEARLLFASMDGLFQHYVLDPANYPLAAVVEALLAHHGVVPPPKEST